MTSILAEGIADGSSDANEDGVITVTEAYTYAARAVAALAAGHALGLNLEQHGEMTLALNHRFKPDAQADGFPSALRQAFSVVQDIAVRLRRAERVAYYVGLTGYYLDGVPYPATGLSVDQNATPNFRSTAAGFACDGWFDESAVHRETVARRGIIRCTWHGQEVRVVRVRIDVKLRDVWGVWAVVKRRRTELFCDREILAKGLEGFHRQTEAFFQGKGDDLRSS